MTAGATAACPVRPMLATSGPLPGGPEWAFEFIWDGVRTLADVTPDRLRLVGGDNRSIAARYPELDVLRERAKRHGMVLDGKVVALDACGRPSFAALQQRMTVDRPSSGLQRRIPVAYYVFDVLRVDDCSTLTLPYRRRREVLAGLGVAGGPVVLPPYFLDVDGQVVAETATQYGLHGVVAKRADSPYQPGRRSRSWVEASLRRGREVVIGGWAPSPRGSAGTLGSLLVGVPTERGLRYAGQVGTGFSLAARRDLPARLACLARGTSPFLDQVPGAVGRRAYWVAPQLVGEVAYRQWSAHGRLMHAAWRGLRPGTHPAAVEAPMVLDASPHLVSRRGEHEHERELDEAVRRARAEVQTLRVPIAPHFLYNALSAIAALVRTDPDRARELLIDFAGLTRYLFRSATRATLDEELENIERYLALEHARLGERLRVTLQVAPEVLPLEVPFLGVLLVVEHAVRHGIEDLPGGGTVATRAATEGADCVITVIDDAPGAPTTGLAGVDDRLRAAFGDDFRLAVTVVPGTGTTVTLRVPKALG